jgi:transposase
MAKPLIPDELWEIIEPLLPPEPPKPKGGRPRIPNRAALTGIVFVLRSGLQWEMLPQEMGCGSGMTCWRRLRDWEKVGVWEKLHKLLLDTLNQEGEIDWSRASLDSQTVSARGVKRGKKQQAKIRQIRENQARSAILWSAEEEYLLR